MALRSLRGGLIVVVLAALVSAGCGDDDDSSNNNSVPAGCGNGVAEEDEACDGDDVRGATCGDHGYHAGGVLCTDTCTLDLSLCEHVGQCGDGYLQQPYEECDDTDLVDVPCSAIGLGYTHGVTTCGGDCSWDHSTCATCGDGTWDTPEPCDDGDDTSAWDGCDFCEIVEFKVNDRDTSVVESNPQVAMAGSGAFAVAYYHVDGDDFYPVLQYYAPDGAFTRSGTELLANSLPMGFDMDDSGAIRMVYFEDSTDDLLVQRFNADLTRDGSPLLISVQPATYRGADIAMTGDGTFVVTWRTGASSSVFMQIYTPNDAPASAPQMVNLPDGWDHKNPRVEIAPDGRVLVLWNAVENLSHKELRARFYSADGTPDGTALTLATGDSHAFYNSDAAFGTGGQAAAAWSQATGSGARSDCYVQRFTVSGTHDGTPIRLNDGLHESVVAPSVHLADDGSVHVTWTEYSGDSLGVTASSGVLARWVDPQGDFVGSVEILNKRDDEGGFFSQKASRQGRYVVVWGITDTASAYAFTGTLYGQRFDALGAPQGLLPW